MKPFNWSKLQTGIVVFLDVDLKVIASRLEGDTSRPLLTADVSGDLARIMEERRGMYEQADVVVEVGGEGVEEVVDMVVKETHRFIDENPPKQYQPPEDEKKED